MMAPEGREFAAGFLAAMRIDNRDGTLTRDDLEHQ